MSPPATWQAIEADLGRSLLRVYDLTPERVRLDATTVSGYYVGGDMVGRDKVTAHNEVILANDGSVVVGCTVHGNIQIGTVQPDPRDKLNAYLGLSVDAGARCAYRNNNHPDNGSTAPHVW